MSEAKYPVRTTETTLSVIDELRSRDSAGVTELADALDLAKSAVHNHLSTLRDHGYVVKEGDEYQLGLKFLEIGGYRRNQMPLFRAAEEQIDWLAEETDELANLLTEQNGKGVYLYRSKGQEGLDYDTYAGKHKYLHATAAGKAILAFMADDRRSEVIRHYGLPAVTDQTITNRDALLDELGDIRDRGVAFDDGEASVGVRCVAAPITTDDRVLGAISTSAPANRMRSDRFRETVPEQVRQAANVIELNIMYP
ncbi:MAG: IclR family transcriptional regulator [Halobacteriales archaeon]